MRHDLRCYTPVVFCERHAEALSLATEVQDILKTMTMPRHTRDSMAISMFHAIGGLQESLEAVKAIQEKIRHERY